MANWTLYLINNAGNISIFSCSAIKAMHNYSRGIPRLINILAHKSMLSAYGKGLTSIAAKQVYLAALDTEDANTKLNFFSFRKSYLLLLLITILGYLLWTTPIASLLAPLL